MESTTKGIGNVGIKARIKQLIALIVVILAGILVSQTVQAQGYHRSKSNHFKVKYRSQIKMNDRACVVLAKKRTTETSATTFKLFTRKPKYRPQAEVDAPVARASKKGEIIHR